MSTFARTVGIALMACCITAPVVQAKAETASKLPAASRYYPLVGHWEGRGQISEPGQAPTAMVLDFACVKAEPDVAGPSANH